MKNKRNIFGFFLGTITFVVIFSIISLVTHIPEIKGAIAFDNALSARGSFIIQTVIALLLHSGMGTFFVTVLYSFVLSVNVVLLYEYYHRFGIVLKKTSPAGMFGAAFGILGIGCAACGTLALTAALSMIGLSWIVLLLPFKGLEVYAIGIVILLISAHRLYRAINKPMTC